MSAAGDRIHAVLKECRGAAQAITAPEIARIVRMDEREVRRHIAEEFRNWLGTGLLVCQPRAGFFFTTEAEDIQRRQCLLISLKLEAATKLADFQNAMRLSGFGGLVTDKIPPTFADESHPEKQEPQRRGGAEVGA